LIRRRRRRREEKEEAVEKSIFDALDR